MEFLEVDGSYGEGGGQILRTALTFSVIQKKPVRVSRIRAGREVPGLRRQHLSAINVLGEIFDGKLTGAFEGSSEISFVPGPPRLDSLSLDMKTAASITLVLQAVVPAVSLSRTKLSIELVGGTDVPWSPTFDYFHAVVREAYSAMGIKFSAMAHRRGYYPKGGGRVSLSVGPCVSVHPLNLLERRGLGAVDLVSRCALLPRHVAERQIHAAASLLEGKGLRVGGTQVKEEQAESPGSSILASVKGDGILIGSDALGAKGKRSEDVGREAAERLAATLDSGACIDANLADMVAPLLSFASGPSELRVPHISGHLDTGLYLAKLFTSCEYSTRSEGSSSVVSIKPNSS